VGFAALLADIMDLVLVTANLNRYWFSSIPLHLEALSPGLTSTCFPETVGAVIGVPVAFDEGATVITCEILNCPSELACHDSSPFYRWAR